MFTEIPDSEIYKTSSDKNVARHGHLRCLVEKLPTGELPGKDNKAVGKLSATIGGSNNQVRGDRSATIGGRYITVTEPDTVGLPSVYLGQGDSDMGGHVVFIALEALPTSDPQEEGQLWNDAGTLKISLG